MNKREKIKSISRETGIAEATIAKRIHLGWPESSLRDKPKEAYSNNKAVMIEKDGAEHTPHEWEKILGLGYGTINGRIRRGVKGNKLFNIVKNKTKQ